VLVVEDRDSEVVFGKPDEKRTDLPAWSTPWAVGRSFAAPGCSRLTSRPKHDVYVIVTDHKFTDLRRLARAAGQSRSSTTAPTRRPVSDHAPTGSPERNTPAQLVDNALCRHIRYLKSGTMLHLIRVRRRASRPDE
jgi:hypothetical protein